MLWGQEAAEVVVSRLEPDAFFAPAHKEMFEAFRGMVERKEPVELLSVVEELKRRQTFEGVGGVAAIQRCENAIGHAANVGYYCGLVQEKWIRRRIIEAGDRLKELGRNEERLLAEVLEECHGALPPIGSVDTEQTVFALSDFIDDVYDDIDRLHESGKIPGISTGLDGLDFMTGGMKPGNLTIIAGRPSMGKTGAACTIAMNAAKAGKKVLYISLEMTKEEIADRLVALEADVDLHRLMTGQMDLGERLLAKQAKPVIRDLPIYLDDRSGKTAPMIRAGVMRQVKKTGLDMVVIDHMHLMNLGSGTQNDTAKWGELSNELKNIAKDYRIPVVALAQLNRQAEGRNDKKPQLSDLRESGTLEQNADLVIGLFRPAYYEKRDAINKGNQTQDYAQEEVILDILKQRNGPTGKVTVGFKSHNVCFFDPCVTNVFQKPQAVVSVPPKLAIVSGTAPATDPMKLWSNSLDEEGFLKEDPFAQEV